MDGGVTKIMVVLMMVVVVVVPVATAAGLTAAQCHEERRLAVNACKSLVKGGLPSPQCCQRARVSHAECICPDVTPIVMAIVGDVNRAIRLIESCHRRVPHHFKCGCV
ncbi:Bifunctional inhibitor/plant lipid transfer protein/seed storage helical domain-containing protein [Cynara cardunculus var. scolymus]|uniref:Bifunctional inhibitor/plant lipid transfer protein/seed storage helical domain-containing protein n=2 Tax=Cynara cardunculus var. scolymus TaxID=59895 RepID=A0A103XDC1_CYNCS|nr:Bifunctional inhibitor/plant lipid transfer protein/seed storage helical domain-containing protein [Cynara cardunculus var. scolymus]